MKCKNRGAENPEDAKICVNQQHGEHGMRPRRTRNEKTGGSFYLAQRKRENEKTEI